MRLGLSIALLAFSDSYEAPLRKGGFVTADEEEWAFARVCHLILFSSEGLLIRDPRIVERKKPGQKKARKKFTW